MNKTGIILISAIAAAVAVAGIVIFCRMPRETGDGGNAITPEKTLEAFYENLLAGDWDGAEALCDTSAIGYVDRFRNTWTMKAGQDSSVMAVLPAILSETEIEVTGRGKTDYGTLRINYQLRFRDSGLKKRTAEMEWRDGTWAIRKIESEQEEEEKNSLANS